MTTPIPQRPQNTDPPLRVAWGQALASIRVRFFRQLVTTLGIALGIAFFASMRTLGAAEGDRPATQTNWLVGTSLIMCLVGITNSMLMSVSERYREIGTIKCLGASDGFIVRVFFFEAILIGVAGSVSGALFGVGLSVAGIALSGGTLPAGQALSIGLVSIVVGVVMTVAAAVAPAVQAAKMPAAAALRVEV